MGAVGFTGGDPRKVDVAGDTMTGDLVLPADPDLPFEAATKQYVDTHSGGGGGGIPVSLLDAKGDLIAATAADTPARLAAGSDGQFLRVNAAASTGVGWDTVGAADVAADPAGSAAAALVAANGYTDGEVAGIDFPVDSVNGATGAVTLNAADVGAAPTSRTIATTAPLTGGGDLTADRTLAVSVGTGSGTVAAGDDARIVGAQQRSTLTAKGDLYVATGAGTTVRVGVGGDGQVLTADAALAAGVKWAPAAGGGGATLVVRKAYVTSGDVTLNLGGGAWNLLPGFALTIPATAGDYVELGVAFMSASGNAFLDLAVVVAGVAVRYASTDTNTPAVEGWPALYKDPNTYRTAVTPWGFQTVAGDVLGGLVTFGVAAKGTTGTLFASANYPFMWIAKNHGAVNYA